MGQSLLRRGLVQVLIGLILAWSSALEFHKFPIIYFFSFLFGFGMVFDVLLSYRWVLGLHYPQKATYVLRIIHKIYESLRTFF